MKVKTTKYPRYNWYDRILDKIGLNRDKKYIVKVTKNDWDVDTILSYVIPPLVRNLKKISHSSPLNIDDKDVPKELRLNREVTDWNDDYYNGLIHRQWEWILDRIAWGFEQTQTDWTEEFFSGEIDLELKKIGEPDEKGSQEITVEQGPNHTFQRDDKAIAKRQKEIEKARKLFAKYFDNLID